MPSFTSGKYTYTLQPVDLKQEQQAFEPGEGVIWCPECLYYYCTLLKLIFRKLN